MNRFAITLAVFAYFATFARVSADVAGFINFEDSTDDTVVTSTILNNGKRGDGNLTVTNFTAGNNTTPQCRVTTSFSAPYFGFNMWGVQSNRAMTIGGTNFLSDGHTRGQRWYYTNSQRAFVRWVVPDSQKITVGCYFRMSTGWSTIGFNSQDIITLTAGSGDFLVLNLQNFQTAGHGTNFLQCHTGFGTADSNDGGMTNVFSPTLNTTYWVSMKVDFTDGVDGTGYAWFYDTNTWARVGVSKLKMDAGSSSSTRIQLVQFGQYEPHGATQAAGTYIDFDNFIIDTNSSPRWPLLPASKTQLAWYAARAGADSAWASVAADDWFFIPASNQTWTTTFNATTRAVVCGLSTNTAITFDVSSQTTDGFYFNQNWSRIMNLRLKCPASANEGRMVHFEANYCRVDHCFLGESYWGVYSEGFNSIDQNIFLNNEKNIRRHGLGNANTLWETYTNAAWVTTNWNYAERNTYYVNSSAVDVGDRNCDSSQEAAMLCDRTNTYVLSAYAYSPIRDAHGDISSLRGVIAGISLGNTFTLSGSASVSGNRFDIRGGRHLINGDVLTGAVGVTDRLREENETGSPVDRVWSTYIWNNTGIGISIGSGNEDFIILNTHYFTAQPSPSPDMPGFPNHIVQYWDGTTYSYFPGGGFAPACCVTAVSTGRPKKD